MKAIVDFFGLMRISETPSPDTSALSTMPTATKSTRR